MNGCEPPAFILPYKSPLALDAVKRGVRASRQRRLLPLVTKYSAQLGPTVELNLLSGTGLGTTDPENIKILLSTHFDGTLQNPILVTWGCSDCMEDLISTRL